MNAPQSRSEINSQQIQKMLDENAQILKAIIEVQNMKGKSMDIIQYQQVLHRNLMYLAGLADPNADLNSILPAPGGSNLLQSQRAPPPNQSISSIPQNMTPPPSSMTTGIPVTGTNMHMSSPNVSVGTGGQGQPQWGNSPMSSMPAQSQYNMKGYAPAPWLSQGNPPGMSPYGGGSMQQRMQLDEQRRRHLLRMHQERLLRTRQMQQQHSAQPTGMASPMNRAMYPSQVPQGSPGYMGPPPQPGGMGQSPYAQQPPPPGIPPPNMPMDM